MFSRFINKENIMAKGLTAAQNANRDCLLKARQRQAENREMDPGMALGLALAESGERFKDLAASEAD